MKITLALIPTLFLYATLAFATDCYEASPFNYSAKCSLENPKLCVGSVVYGTIPNQAKMDCSPLHISEVDECKGLFDDHATEQFSVKEAEYTTMEMNVFPTAKACRDDEAKPAPPSDGNGLPPLDSNGNCVPGHEDGPVGVCIPCPQGPDSTGCTP